MTRLTAILTVAKDLVDVDEGDDRGEHVHVVDQLIVRGVSREDECAGASAGLVLEVAANSGEVDEGVDAEFLEDAGR